MAVTDDEPSTSVPVTISADRCDPHAVAEFKRPYVFLSWVAVGDARPRARSSSSSRAAPATGPHGPHRDLLDLSPSEPARAGSAHARSHRLHGVAGADAATCHAHLLCRARGEHERGADDDRARQRAASGPAVRRGPRRTRSSPSLGSSRRCTSTPGTTFIARGALEDWLYVVAAGSVRVHVGDRDARRARAGRGRRRAGRPGAGAAVGIGHRGRAVAAAPPASRALRGAAGGPAGDRPRPVIHTLARLLQAADHGPTARDDRDAALDPVGRAPGRCSWPAQAFALGLLMSWILIPASAIFLSTYGADLLPVTYLGAARGRGGVERGAVVRAPSDARWSAVALRVLAGVADRARRRLGPAGERRARGSPSGSSCSSRSSCRWASCSSSARPGCCSTSGPSRRSTRGSSPGSPSGFVVGGLAAPPLLGLLGRTEHLVLGAAAAARPVAGAARAAPAASSAPSCPRVEHDDSVDPDDAPSWGDLLRHRYVALIVAFQMLSAVESQWLDYLVYERATERYEDSEDLARFISRFTAIAYGADIVFLLLVAGPAAAPVRAALRAHRQPGRRPRRWWWRWWRSSSLQGAGATVVFVLIVAARVTDLVLADGAARTSLSAAYQVVPTPTAAGGAGRASRASPCRSPSGASGAGAARPPGDGRAPAGWCSRCSSPLVVAVWLVVAVLVHRSYRTNLLSSLRFRTLDPAALVDRRRQRPRGGRRPARQRRPPGHPARPRHPHPRGAPHASRIASSASPVTPAPWCGSMPSSGSPVVDAGPCPRGRPARAWPTGARWCAPSAVEVLASIGGFADLPAVAELAHDEDAGRPWSRSSARSPPRATSGCGRAWPPELDALATVPRRRPAHGRGAGSRRAAPWPGSIVDPASASSRMPTTGWRRHTLAATRWPQRRRRDRRGRAPAAATGRRPSPRPRPSPVPETPRSYWWTRGWSRRRGRRTGAGAPRARRPRHRRAGGHRGARSPPGSPRSRRSASPS